MRYSELRIKVRHKGNKIYIPRYVGGLVYAPSALSESSAFLRGHEKLVLGCLSRPFYIDELFCKEGDTLLSAELRHQKVMLRKGPVLRRLRVVDDGLSAPRHYLYFYVPVNELDGSACGYAEIRNVQSLFHVLTRLFPDIKLATDLISE